MNKQKHSPNRTSLSLQQTSIDFSEQRGYVSRVDKIQFSADRLLQMLNHRASQSLVTRTAFGSLRVQVGSAKCEISREAVQHLRETYTQCHEHQHFYPFCFSLLH